MPQNLKPRKGKAPLHLLPFRPLRVIAAAMEQGALKYKRDNWREHDADAIRDLYGAAALRHVRAYLEPDDTDDDPESGVHHLGHAGACILIMLWHTTADYVAPRVPDKPAG